MGTHWKFLGKVLLTHLTLSMLGKTFSRRHFEIPFSFSPENRLWHSMQIVSIGANLHEMPKPIFWKSSLWRNKKHYPRIISTITSDAGLHSTVSIASDCRSRPALVAPLCWVPVHLEIRRSLVRSPRVQQHSFMKIDREIVSVGILSLQLIQEGQ